MQETLQVEEVVDNQFPIISILGLATVLYKGFAVSVNQENPQFAVFALLLPRQTIGAILTMELRGESRR